MTERTIAAILAALVLGPFFGYSVANSGYAGFTVLVFACLFCPLVVSLIADQRIVLLALLPNPLLVLMWLIVGEIQHPEQQHFEIHTISGMFLFAIPSLLVSLPVYFVRRLLARSPS